MSQIGTLYLGKRGKGAYIRFKGKKTIQKATIDDYEDFITGHNGLTKAQKKHLLLGTLNMKNTNFRC